MEMMEDEDRQDTPRYRAVFIVLDVLGTAFFVCAAVSVHLHDIPNDYLNEASRPSPVGVQSAVIVIRDERKSRTARYN